MASAKQFVAADGRKVTRVPMVSDEEWEKNKELLSDLMMDPTGLGGRLSEMFPHNGPFYTMTAKLDDGRVAVMVVNLRTRKTKMLLPDGRIEDAPTVSKNISEDMWQKLGQFVNAAALATPSVGPKGLLPVVV